jgi:hypothetical protein
MTPSPSNAQSSDPRSELSSLIKAGLGRSVAEDKLSGLVIMQERLQHRIGELSALLMDHKITRRRYLEELDKALAEACRTGQKLIGARNFFKVFGDMRADHLGDVSAFLEESD